MPRIPVYNGGQVRTVAAPDTRLGLRATPDAFGGSIAEGVQALGRATATVASVTDRIAQREIDRVNQIAVLEAKAKLESTLSPKLSKARQTRGKAAIGIGETMLPEYDTLAKDIEKGLSTPEQREAFQAFAIGRRVDIQGMLDNHAAAGMREWEDQTFKANEDILRQRVADTYTDEAQVAKALEERIGEIADYADRNGLPTEWRNSMQRATSSATIRQVITAHMDAGNDLAAQKVVERYGNGLTAEDKSYVTRLVESGSSKNEGLRQGMAIYGQGGKTLEDMVAEAEKIENPRVRDETKRWLGEKYQLARAARTENQDRLFLDTYNEAKNNPAGLRAIPESRLQLFDPEIRERLESVFRRETAGVKLPWEQSKANRYKIEAELSNPQTRDQWVKRGPAAFLGLMNEDDQNAIASMIKEVKDGKDSGSALASKQDMLDEGLARIGLDTNPVRTTTTGGKTTVTYNQRTVKFRDAVQRRIDAVKAEGKPVTPEIMRKAVDDEVLRWSRKMTVPGRAWGERTVRFADTTAASGLATAPEQVPQADRAAIIAAFKAKGGTPTEADIVDAFNAKLEADARAE